MDTDILTLFQDALERFNRERYSPAQLVAYTKQPAGHSQQLWDEMAEMGWFHLLQGFDDTQSPTSSVSPLLPVFRAAGEGLWREPVRNALGESAAVVAQVADPARREALIEGLMSGTAPLCYAARESGDGWQRVKVRTQAQGSGDGIVVSGCKIAIEGHDSCAGFVVLASDSGSGQTGYYLVAADASGIERLPYKSVEGRWIADLKLDRAPAEFLCGAEGAARVEAWGSILAAAESIGVMHGANHDTVEYLRERKQFGRALLSFQALQHRLVEMQMLERETEALLQDTAVAFDTGAPALERRVMILRAQTSRATRHVTKEAVQMHGGMGVTQELRVSHYYRRALMLDGNFGSEDWALERLSAA